MKPAGMLVRDRTCDGCETHHVTVWWTVTDLGRFRAYCETCWARIVGVWL